MCISFPGRVVSVDAAGAFVESAGRRRRASTLLIPDIAVGEWVAVAAGSIVERLDAAEAAELLALLRLATEPEPAANTSSLHQGDRHVHAT